MVVAIDGPAGVGKSTIAKLISEKSGFFYLNSGNFYRAISKYALDHKIHHTDHKKIIESLSECNIQLIDGRIILNKLDIDDVLHTDQVDSVVAEISAIIEVRHFVNNLIQNISKEIDIVVEGRDMTTVVFPLAEVKIFLDASVKTRAKRRFDQGVSSLSLKEIEEKIEKRDKIDRNKEFGNLKIADDAIYLDTSDLTIDQVCEKVLNKINKINNQSRST